MMSEKLDSVLQEMAELTSAVKSANGDAGTRDWDKLAGEFEGLQKETAQLKDQLDNRPVFKGDAQYADGVDKAIRSGELKGTRYAPVVKDIGSNGYHKDFTGTKVQAADIYMAHKVLAKRAFLFPDQFHAPSADLKLALKALSSTGSGTGDELVPTNLASELWEDVHLSNVLANNLVRVPMTSNPMELPNALGDVTFRVGSENVATTASDPATAKNTLTVTEHVGEVDWSYSLDEDAVVALMPAVRSTVARNAAEYIDGFCLNADGTTAATGNINSDDGAPAVTSYYISAGQDGVRHLPIVDNTDQHFNAGGDALTDADITSTMALMGKYAANPRDLLIVTDVWTYLRGFLNATTTSAPGTFLTDASAVGYSIIATGQVAAYRGIPIVIPTYGNRAEADGKQSTVAASNALGFVALLNRSQWKVGFRRDVQIEVDRDIQKRQMIMVVSYRVAVGCRGTRSSATHTAAIRNILVT